MALAMGRLIACYASFVVAGLTLTQYFNAGKQRKRRALHLIHTVATTGHYHVLYFDLVAEPIGQSMATLPRPLHNKLRKDFFPAS